MLFLCTFTIYALLKSFYNKPLGVFEPGRRPRQSEVTNLHAAILIDEDIGRLYISMQNLARVHVLE